MASFLRRTISIIAKRPLLSIGWPVLSLIAAAASPALARSQAQNVATIASAVNEFGFRLLHELHPNQDSNVVISPFSVGMALAMLRNGAAGQTRTAIARTLNLAPGEDQEINPANHSLADVIRNADPGVTMAIANALWVQTGFPIEPEFVQLSRRFYDAPIDNLDFKGNPQQAAEVINRWVARETRDKIKTIVGPPSRATRLILTDAIYFKGRWSAPFDKKETAPRPFELGSGRTISLPMMARSANYQYLENDRIQAIRLPYGNQRFAMYVVLPRQPAAFPKLAQSLDLSTWQQWTAGLSWRKGTIVMPRFELAWGASLNQPLEGLGMKVAFNIEQADFSLIHPPPQSLAVSEVRHKTYIKVDEEGTEAAAATSIGVATSMIQSREPPPFKMVVDHPFFCVIAERQSGALLFVGVIVNPQRQR